MSLKNDLEIKMDEVREVYVQRQNDRLSGTPDENKKVFDVYPDLIRSRFNEALDALDDAFVDVDTTSAGLEGRIEALEEINVEDAAVSARASAESASASATQAQSALAEATSYAVKHFKQKWVTSAGGFDEFEFNPSGYTYSADDYFEVYVNGFKLDEGAYELDSNIVFLNESIEEADNVVEVCVAKYINPATYVAQAQEYAEDAEASREDAEGWAGSAYRYAEDAEASVTSVSNAEERIRAVAIETEGYRNDADGFKNDAETAASNASTSATQASGSATQAQTYAGNASTSATQAQTYAGNASTSATQAQTYAGNASTSAAEAEATLSDVKSDLSYFNFRSVNFRIAQNTSHSYNQNVCSISAISGDIIFVSIKTADDSAIACQVFARKTDGTFAKLKDTTTDGDALQFTLSYDISGIGIYFGTQSSEKNISVLVNKENSFLFIPEELEEVETIARTGSCNFDPLLFKVGTLYSGTYSQYVYNRIATYPSFLKFGYPVTISVVDSGWRFGVHTFSSASESAFVADSGWQTSNYTVPANTYFRIVVARETEVSETADVNEWISHISYDSEISQRISSIEAEVIDVPTYSYDGETIDFKKHGFEATRIGTVMAKPEGTTNPQGFAIYNNVICQLYSDNKLILANYPERSIIATLDIVSGHGDTMDFSNEFYDSSDEFPLAYITADTNPATVYVVRITRSATTLVRTLYFADVSKTGYYAGHCIDPDTNILYMVGYLQSSYDDSTNNKMIVSSWDLNNLTDNGDNTYIPEYIESFNVPFMKTVQGQKVFDNKLWLLSSPFGTFNTVIYVVDPYRKKIVTTMADFPTALKETECEDISFVLENSKYHIVISCYYYYRLDFN